MCRPPTSTLFPSTTLFRSIGLDVLVEERGRAALEAQAPQPARVAGVRHRRGHLEEREVADQRAEAAAVQAEHRHRSEEQRLNSSHMSISYAVFCLKKKRIN